MWARAKSRVRICRGPGAQWLWIAALLGLSGCTPPAVAARAVWIGSTREEDGSRTLYSYAAGTITSSSLGATRRDAGAQKLPILVELEPRGRGVLVRAVDQGWLHELGEEGGLQAGYVDLTQARALPLWLPTAAQSAQFTGAGDALVWLEGCAPTVAVLPLAPGAALAREMHGERWTLAPLRRTLGSTGKPAQRGCGDETQHAMVSAADAPVIFTLEASVQDDTLRVKEEATIEVLRYPASAAAAMELGPVVRGRLPAGEIPRRLPSLRCPGGPCGIAAVDPSGEGVSVAVYGGTCQLLRVLASTGEVQCAVGPEAPEVLRSAQLIAAISSEHYVYREGMTLHRYAWRTRELASRPLPGAIGELSVQVTVDGRAVVASTSAGTALRVDVATLELLSVERQACEGPQPPVISPSGRYLAWTCGADRTGSSAFALEPQVGEVVRVSGAGMERYQGVPMWALAIDDEGDLLLHSRRNRVVNSELRLPAGAPRNLYVLAADGELARIDGLEPEPELMLGLGSSVYRWMAAAAL